MVLLLWRSLKQGEAGSRVYQAIAEYAFNTGRTFIGDPAGLSPIALRRRTQAMLSSALKHGTTRHLAPHEDQVTGNAEIGVPPLRWKSGDHLGNIQAMIDVSVASMKSIIPEIDRARYDFETRTFRNSEGRHLSDAVLDRWASSSERVREARAGIATAKRSILLATLSRAESGERPGILEQALRLAGQLVRNGGLSDTFYSSARGRKRRSGVDDLKARLARGPLSKYTTALQRSGKLRLHQSVSDLPGIGHPANAQAMTDGEGVIHLVADNLHAARAESVVLHEAFHAGARSLLGDAGFNRLMDRLGGFLEAAKQRKVMGERGGSSDVWWDRALERVEAAGIADPAEQAEELAAYAIEELEAAPAGVRDLVNRILAKIKVWVQDVFGRQPGEVTPEQLREIALQTLANYQSAPDVGRPGSTAAMNSAVASDQPSTSMLSSV